MYYTWEKYSNFEFDGSNIIFKKLEQAHVSHCLAFTLILPKLCKHLATEETSWIFGRGILSHSCLMEESICSTILCWIFHFVMHQMFSVGEDWTIDRPH